MKKISYAVLFILVGLTTRAQIIYQHTFGTATFTPVNPYTVAPNMIDANLSGSQWATSFASGFSSLAGSAGQALSLSNSSGTPTYSLSFTVASGFNCDITAYSFWRQRSTSGAQNWTLTVNGVTTIGTGTVPTVGINTGTLASSNAANGLSGTVNVVLQLSGATSTGTFRLDDFTLYGSTYPVSSCTPPATQASVFVSSGITNTSANVSWTAGSGANVIVLARQGSAVNSSPSSGTVYTANSTYALGQQVGTGNFVVYNGTGTSVNVTGLSPATTYYFSVFEYDTPAGSTCYLIPGLTGNLLTTGVISCLQIKGILVDACNGTGSGLGVSEPYNEMVRFHTGSSAIPISQISIAGRGNTGGWNANKWPNAAQSWHGLVQNANTANKVATLNSTIVGCGYIKEPAVGIIPANKDVIMVTSQYLNTTLNSFANLNDTIFIVFQDTVSDAVAGHFSNYVAGPPSSYRSLKLIDNLSGCVDTVTYDITALLNHTDGDAVEYDDPGTPTYVNRGCNAPFNPLTVDAGVNKNLCQGSSVALTSTVTGVYNTVMWSGGAGTFSSPSALTTSYTPTAGESGSTIKLYITVTNNCPPKSVVTKDSVYITNLQLPFATINATNGYSLCPLASTVLSYSLSNASATGTMSTAWSLPAASTNTYAVSAPTGTAPVTYTLNLTNFCGVASQTINVYPLASPSVTISVPTLTACAGNTVAVSAVSNSGNYSWNNPAGATTASVVLTANTTTTGIVTTTNSCGTKTDSYTLTVIQQPTVSISPSAVSLCTGQSATVTANANTAVTYTWSGTGVNGLNTNTVSLNIAGVYTVVASNICNTSTAQVNVVVNSAASLTISSTNTLLCGSNTATLSGGTTGTYVWSSGTSTTSILPITTGGVYTATVTTPTCGSATASITVLSLPTPTLSVNSNSVSICVGQSAILTATSNTMPYQWSTGATTNTISVNSPTSTPVTYTVGVSNACGSASASVVVSSATLPNLSINTPSLTLCAGSTETLTLSGSTGTYAWSVGTSTTTSLPITTGGVYSATVTTAGCGSATASVTIASLQTPTLTVASNTAIICNNTPIILTATSTYTNNYSWLPLAASTNTLQVLTPLVYTVTSTNSCGSAVQTITVTSGTTPILTVTPTSTVVCSGNTTPITVIGGTGNYNWIGVSSTSSVVSVSSGTYIVSNTNACGTGSQTVIVNTSTVSAGLDGIPTTGTSPLSVSFSNLSSGATTYTWNYGNGTSSNGVTPVSQTYTTAGVYTVVLSVTNSDGCTSSQSIVITVKNEDATLVIPNVFTPNNDSINDLFYVKATNIADFNCVIFDRWGLQFYSWSDLKGGWDGKTGGKDATDGTYFFIINATDTNGKDVKRQGSFLLIR